MKSEIYLNSLGIINSLGCDKKSVIKSVIENKIGLTTQTKLISGKTTCIGAISNSLLPTIPKSLSKYDCRNNQITLQACLQIVSDIKNAIQKYGKRRMGVVLGTSTSGIDNGEKAIIQKMKGRAFPQGFDYIQQETAGLSEFIKDYFELEGVAYTISTACSSSGKAFSSAARLLEQNICDAVIVGGCDSLCRLTLNGFDCLDAISSQICKPFHNDRNGINIGEGAAVFLMSREQSNIQLLGVGESSDGYHITAPDPTGNGAEVAMKMALAKADLSSNDIGYLNLHGTATTLNDSMEANAVKSVFSRETVCSSTKSLTGHTLGAAAATEVAICWLLLSDVYNSEKKLPKQYNSSENIIKDVGIITEETIYDKPYFMSNSFAFGGNNVSVVIGKNSNDM